MSSRSLWVLLLLGGSIVAGCAAPDGPGSSSPPPPTPYVFVDPMVSGDDEHDHGDPLQHQFASNVSLWAHEALTVEGGQTAQSHAIDLCGDWAVLSRHAPGEYGVDIVDVSDPLSPQWIGQYRDPEAVPADRDVAWSEDCLYVFMANEGSTQTSSGMRVINATAKDKPVFESFYYSPTVAPPANPLAPDRFTGSYHTVFAAKMGGVQYVYGLNYGVHIFRLDRGTDGKQTLVPVGRYISADAQRILDANQEGDVNRTTTRRTIYGHDMAVYEDAGRIILYVAYAYDGLRIVDITNPSSPSLLGHWVPPESDGYPHYVHSVRTYLRDDGKRITVLGAETFESWFLKEPSPFWVLDTTSFADIKHLSTWTNPGGHGGDQLLHSLHFYEIEDEILWLTHYHGGIWALDLSEPSKPVIAGYYMPHQDTGYIPPSGCCLGYKLAGIPMTFDVKVRDGVAYAADFATGLYVVSLQPNPLAAG